MGKKEITISDCLCEIKQEIEGLQDISQRILDELKITQELVKELKQSKQED